MSTDLLDVIRSEISGVLSRIDSAQLATMTSELDAAERVFVAGAGRSGFMVNALAMRLVHLASRVHVVGEATAPSMADGDVLVAVSGSGTTAGTVRTADEAARAGCRVLAVTTDPASPLAERAQAILHVPAATKYRRDGEAGTIQPLSSLFDQCTHLLFDAICLRLAETRGIDNATAKQAHVTTE